MYFGTHADDRRITNESLSIKRVKCGGGDDGNAFSLCLVMFSAALSGSGKESKDKGDSDGDVRTVTFYVTMTGHRASECIQLSGSANTWT